MNKKVVVIGGGVAGMEASAYLGALGFDVTLIEKSERLGGHVVNWDRLFPTFRLGVEVIDFLNKGIISENVRVMYNTEVVQAQKNNNQYHLILNTQQKLEADAVLVTTGYDLFDAHRKEEYGYGIYDNVITSADLENVFLTGRELLTAQDKIPSRVAIIHCVGSRDEKVGNTYCSKVCCVTGVKQAIEIKQKYPKTEVFNFYMDMRMYAMHFEAMYKEAQEKYGVNFIRGRLSESAENIDGSILIKVEDTLAGRPMRMNVDLLVLLVGIVPSEGTIAMGKLFGIEFGVNGFYKTRDQHTLTNVSNVPGLFFAGTCTSPKTITNSITDARAAAAAVTAYLNGYTLNER